VLETLGESLLAGDFGLLYFAGSQHRPWLTPVMRGLTSLGDGWTIVLLSILSYLLLVFLRRRREAVVLFLVTLTAFLLMVALKSWIGRERPDVAWRLIDRPSDSSFPSGHAFCGLTFYGLLTLMLARGRPPRLRRVIVPVGFTLALGVGLSRIYLGVHYPLDVLGGWLGGTAMLLVGQTLIAPAETAESGPLPGSTDPTAQSG
jgi:undecaprenyl-diphosphatase